MDLNMKIEKNAITALIGPSGCGKSTFLRCLNRMNDLIDGCRVEGEILIEGKDMYKGDMNVVDLRTRVGMVFQKPNPFPMSLLITSRMDRAARALRIRRCSRRSSSSHCSARHCGMRSRIVKDSAYGLSGGQQQRLCFARAIAMEPEVILMDEPTSALDPISTNKIEELAIELKKDYTIVIVTHNMQQAARVSDLYRILPAGRNGGIDKTSVIFQIRRISARKITSPKIRINRRQYTMIRIDGKLSQMEQTLVRWEIASSACTNVCVRCWRSQIRKENWRSLRRMTVSTIWKKRSMTWQSNHWRC